MLGIWEETGRSEDFGMKYLAIFLLVYLGVSLGEKIMHPWLLYFLGFAVGAVAMAIYYFC